MPKSAMRPLLRPVETIVVPDPQHGRLLVLRDTQGVTDAHACIQAALIPILARFTGDMTCAEIAQEVSSETGEEVTAALVRGLAEELDRGLFLEGPTYRAALDRIRAEFHESPTRAASHAGGAYLAAKDALAKDLDDRCLSHGNDSPSVAAGRHLSALIAPHIDPWRGAVGYGRAYETLKRDLAPEADTFIVFGTSHAPMREPFALCRKAFDTPLGPVPADHDAIDAIAARCPYDPYTDELNHKREHSIEFQALFVRHIVGQRPVTIVPILAGLGRHQAHRSDPRTDPDAMALLDAVRDLVAQRGRRAVVIAGADLAHVGPRFGDAEPWNASQRDALAASDRASLGLAVGRDAAGFWSDVARDLESRRVCGLAPVYALLETMMPESKGALLHYEQTIDGDDGSIVSHAAVGYYAEADS
jgi:AmmeMemoRadiSam system protein B